MILDYPLFFVLIVIAFCTFIQSLFGVGLLVFGTPLLLLGGFSFTDAIGIVLPCSIVVSLSQVLVSKSAIDKESWFVVAWTSPFVILSLSIYLMSDGQINIRGLVGAMLIISSLVREWPLLQKQLQQFLKDRSIIYLSLTGVIHGFTNMGGALLSLYCATAFNEKNRIRNSIALAYTVMASCQLGVAFYFGNLTFSYLHFIYVLLAFSFYTVVGEKLFQSIRPATYKTLLTAFMAVLGVVLLTA